MPPRSVDRDLVLRLDDIRREHGDVVRVDDIADVVRSLLDSLTGDISTADLRLYRELESLADYIQSARAEIAALRPDEIKSEFIPTATDELDAIVGATEAATNHILDAAEKLESLAVMMEPEMAEKLTEVTTGIYESCNFQDITGQRITKVVRMLKDIEGRVESLIRAFGAEFAPDASRPPPAEPPKEKTDEDLLNGPQLPDNAADQAEIDRLLASFD